MASENIKKPLNEWRNDYEADTGTISTIVRSLGLGGIAIIWVFKTTVNGQEIIPSVLLIPFKILIIGLGIDLFQYLWRAGTIAIFYRIKEKKYNNKELTDAQIEDVTIPTFIPDIGWGLFISKVLVIILAYIHIYFYILTYVIQQ